MEITTSQKQGRVPVAVFHVQGVVDSASYQEFSRRVRAQVEAGAEYLLLDLADVSYMSSAGIRSLNELALLMRGKFAHDEKSKMSNRVKLLSPQERVLDVLKISGVDLVFEIHANLEAAVASF
ncbi:MAG: STAS domain-containing protein [Chloroflexi bacterium]|nr:STAS domain-containing protein [Chloroflexota bacterium]